jgi:hypothetical protein
MTVGRCGPTAQVLSNGKAIIIAGGDSNGTFSDAEIYDPSTGMFTSAGSIGPQWGGPASATLPSGLVLVAGGAASANAGSESTAAASLYDPATGSFRPTGSMTVPRDDAWLTSLPSGDVLVIGGYNLESSSILWSAEIYDPSTETFTATGSMMWAPNGVPVLLSSGKVLVPTANGASVPAAETFDPQTRAFTAGTYVTPTSLFVQTVATLPNGLALFVGPNVVHPYDGTTGASIYDPATGFFSTTWPMVNHHAGHTETLLPSGAVLVAGGGNNSAELYQP